MRERERERERESLATKSASFEVYWFKRGDRVIAAWHIFNVVMCDRKLSVKLKGKFYKTVVRPAILYGSETWATRKDKKHD